MVESEPQNFYRPRIGVANEIALRQWVRNSEGKLLGAGQALVWRKRRNRKIPSPIEFVI